MGMKSLNEKIKPRNVERRGLVLEEFDRKMTIDVHFFGPQTVHKNATIFERSDFKIHIF